MKNAQIGRRKFVKVSTAGMVAAAAAAKADGLVPVTQDARPARNSRKNKIDVLVVGGGTAGTIAAIQAARMGAKTLLIERGAQLGGTTTTGGVAWPGLFHAWRKQIIAGIGWELVKESVELDGGTMPDFSVPAAPHWKHQVEVNQFLYALLAEEKCEQAGVEIAYYEFPTHVTKTAAGWTVDCVGFGTQRTVNCSQIIDCTGGAEVVGLMGGMRLREEETQPGSYLFMIGKEHTPGRGQCQRLYVHGADSTNSETVTAANLTGRKAVLQRLREKRKKNKELQLTHLQPETSFRESYRIQGETVITVDDYTSGRVFEDAICNAFYPVDLHTKTGVRPQRLKGGVVPTVPLSALAPAGIPNVLVAGRCVSSDRLANSGLRVQASCMAMGQAAGVASALAVMKGTTPLKVPLEEIRKALVSHNAILAGESRPVGEDAGGGAAQKTNAPAQVRSGSDKLIDVAFASTMGTWIKGRAFRPTIGSSYLHDNDEGKGEKSITFELKVDAPATYAIKLHYNAHVSRSSCTPVRVQIGDQVQELVVNQRKSDGVGHVLGAFEIQDEAKVTISNQGTDGYVIVDGLELIEQ
jgi:hypothetical protein